MLSSREIKVLDTSRKKNEKIKLLKKLKSTRKHKILKKHYDGLTSGKQYI